MEHHDTTPDRGEVDGSGYPVASAKSHLPKLALEMLDMGLPNPFQTYGFDTFNQTQKGPLHVL